MWDIFSSLYHNSFYIEVRVNHLTISFLSVALPPRFIPLFLFFCLITLFVETNARLPLFTWWLDSLPLSFRLARSLSLSISILPLPEQRQGPPCLPADCCRVWRWELAKLLDFEETMDSHAGARRDAETSAYPPLASGIFKVSYVTPTARHRRRPPVSPGFPHYAFYLYFVLSILGHV